MAPLVVVLGPARSGKSRWAEHLAGQACRGGQVHYFATGFNDPTDQAWQQRVERHRRRRPAEWLSREVGPDLAPGLCRLGPDDLALVDSLGSWVAHGLDLDDDAWQQACARLLDALQACPAELIVVSEQAGWGVVPATAIGGLFRDRLGQLEQRLVDLGDRCWLVLAGRAIELSALSQAVPGCP